MLECPYTEEYGVLIKLLRRDHSVVLGREPYRNETQTRWLIDLVIDGKTVKYYFSEAQGKWRKK